MPSPECSVEVFGIASKIGSGATQFAIAAWAALGIAALLWAVACCNTDAEKKVQPGRIGIWFLSWAALTVFIGDLSHAALAWTVAGQLVAAASPLVFVAAPTLLRRTSGAAAAAGALVLWGITVALAFALIRVSTRGTSGGASCAAYQRHTRAITGAAAATAVCAMITAAVSNAQRSRKDTALSYALALPH